MSNLHFVFQVEDNVWNCNSSIYSISAWNGNLSGESSVALSGCPATLFCHLSRKIQLDVMSSKPAITKQAAQNLSPRELTFLYKILLLDN